MRRVLAIALLPVILAGMAVAFNLQSGYVLRSYAQRSAGRMAMSGADASLYLYYTLKGSNGFVLARAPRGADGQPAGTPQQIAQFGDSFGLAESDNVLFMQSSPDGRFVAIDGTRDHGEQVWMYDVQQGTLSLTPPYVMGNFLHWLPGGHTFLYRPMFPMGPSAPMDGGAWNPGLWEVDAATGEHKNIDIGMSSAFLIDAASSPDGTRIVYSTTLGLGMGSDTWLMNSDGGNRTHLFSTPGGAQSIAGLFSWSPDGKTIAYERLSDSPTPFLPAGVWVMDSQGGRQQLLAQADGGHGFTLVWSPDGHKIAFVMRTNLGDSRADTNAQSLQSAIAVVDVTTGQTWTVASSSETGMQINVNPVWARDGKSITFTAFNPLNRVLGGTPRYWSARVLGPYAHPSVAPLTGPISHVIAVE